MELLVLTLATLIGTLLALEVKAWLPYVSRRLIAGAVARFPAGIGEADRDRWRREIEADLLAFEDRPLGGFLFALRVRFKGGRDLAAELALGEKIAKPESATEASPPSAPPPADEEVRHVFVSSSLRYRTGIPRLNRVTPEEAEAFLAWVRRRRKDSR